MAPVLRERERGRDIEMAAETATEMDMTSAAPSTITNHPDAFIPPNAHFLPAVVYPNPVSLDNTNGEISFGPDHFLASEQLHIPLTESDQLSSTLQPPTSEARTPSKGRSKPKEPKLKETNNSRKSRSRTSTKTAQPDIPLICHVCEGQPTFSDASHLLTHCASRAHTKRYLDLRARAQSCDDQATETLKTFDEWYERNGVGPLLGKRLREKDEKDQEKKAEAQKRQKSSHSTITIAKKNKMVRTRSQIKQEPNDEEGETLQPTVIGAPSLNTPNPFRPNLGGHAGAFTPAQFPYIDQHFDGSAIGLDTPGDDSPYADEYIDDEEEDETRSRPPTLKGKIWPGMNLFDAASKDERRRRNQRKDNSVLQRMELASQKIETTEMVSDLNLALERYRDVYDEPSDLEDLLESVSPKKRPGSMRSHATPRSQSRATSKGKSPSKSTPKTPRSHQKKSKSAVSTRESISKRATRGSAARAQNRISKQAQIECREEIDEEDEDGDRSTGNVSVFEPSATSDHRKSDQFSESKHSIGGDSDEGNSCAPEMQLLGTEYPDVFRDDDADSATIPQLAGDGQTGPRSGQVYYFTPPPHEMGMMPQHPSQGMMHQGLLPSIPRGLWSAGIPNEVNPMSFNNIYSDGMPYSQGMGFQNHGSPWTQMHPSFNDFQGNAFRGNPGLAAHTSWPPMNGGVDQNSYFDANWRPNSQAASYDQSEQEHEMFGDS